MDEYDLQHAPRSTASLLDFCSIMSFSLAPLSGAFADTSTDQLVQAMAGFDGGGTSDGLNAFGFGTETTPPKLLTMPS